MNADPAISVVIATCNQADYLTEALETVLKQTLPSNEYEVIVVNDGSTDSTNQLLQRYKKRIICIEQSNQGLIKSCNIALERSRGKYVIRVDSDDRIDENLLYLGKEVLDSHKDACCVYSDRYQIANSGGEKRVRVGRGNLYRLIACGTMFRADAVGAVGGYRPFFWEEYDLYFRLADKGDFMYLPIPLYFYRRHSKNMTHHQQQRMQGWIELLQEWGVRKVRAMGFDRDLERAIKNFSLTRGAA